MPRLLTKKSTFKKSMLLMTAGLILITTPAYAGNPDCPLHKKMAAQQAQQSPVVQTVAVYVSPQQQITPASLSVAPLTQPIAQPLTQVSPSIIQQIETPQRVENTVAIKEVQNNYGSGTAQASVKASPHAAFTGILSKYVSAPDGQGLTHFNYNGLKANGADKAALDNYIKDLEGVNPNNLPQNEAIAFYANLYNAVTVQVIVDNYPVKSIKKLGPLGSGPWKKKLFTLNGEPSSLNAVEHDILRKQFPSPYVHYMVNCASVGCPNLLNSAWEASSLDRVKEQAAADYINSPRGVQITSKGLKVSSIFKWFKGDFGGNSGLLQHIRKHARPELAQAIDNGAQVVDYGYDWSLNE